MINCEDFGYESFEVIESYMRKWSLSLVKENQVWVGEHPLIVTQGLRNQDDHVRYWPVSKSYRGGLTTMHLPGQLLFYTLCHIGSADRITSYVSLLENMIISYLATHKHKITLYTHQTHRGVFSQKGKIASIGLKYYKNYVYYGLSFNLCCSLNALNSIVLCGLDSQKATSLIEHNIFIPISDVKRDLCTLFCKSYKTFMENE